MESNYFDWRNRIPKNFSNVPLNKRIDGYPTFEEFINFIVFSNQLDEDGDIDVHARPYWHQVIMKFGFQKITSFEIFLFYFSVICAP